MHNDEEDVRLALLALRGGLRGRFRLSFDRMENAFEALEDRLMAVDPAGREELAPLMEEVRLQFACLRRLSDQAADAATASLLHGTCAPCPMDLAGQLREFTQMLQEEAAQFRLPFKVRFWDAGIQVLPTMGDPSLLTGLLTNLVSNTLVTDSCATITLECTRGQFIYRDNGPGLQPDAVALLLDDRWSERLLREGGLGLPLIAIYARTMGWRLSMEDKPGTNLVFDLPPCTADLDALVLESDMQRRGESMRRRLTLEQALRILAARRPK